MEAQIAEHVDLDIINLAYHAEFLSWLKPEKTKVRPLIIATVSHVKYAEGIADYLGIFDKIFASNSTSSQEVAQKLVE